MLKETFAEQALSQARTFEWFKSFKDGRESVEDRKQYTISCTIYNMKTFLRNTAHKSTSSFLNEPSNPKSGLLLIMARYFLFY
jgi:hypothetical protein